MSKASRADKARYARLVLLSLALAGSAVLGSAAWAGDSARSQLHAVVDDTAITTKVRAQLVASPVTKAREMDIMTRNGTVFLNGFVDSAQERSQAAAIAARVQGVARVQNDLQLRQGERDAKTVADDVLITTRVKAALALDHNVTASAIDVSTYAGVVSLSGMVYTPTAKAEAEKAAADVAGVKSVKNSLMVQNA